MKLSDATLLVEMYAREHAATIRFYDFCGEPDEVRPATGPISLTDIGRMAIVNAELTAADVAYLLSLNDVPWSSVPPTARLDDANPDDPDGLYVAMRSLWGKIRVKKSGIGPAKASKLLHIKRPFAFPILDRDVTNTYTKRYRKLRDYWYLMRDDLLDGADDLRKMQEHLGSAKSPDVIQASRLPALRLLDIIASQLQHV